MPTRLLTLGLLEVPSWWHGSENIIRGTVGIGGCIASMRMFSHNARLYLLTSLEWISSMEPGKSSSTSYLLAAGFSIKFVGLWLLIQGIAGALAAVPAGWLGYRIDRRWGFIIGDGGGAVVPGAARAGARHGDEKR